MKILIIPLAWCVILWEGLDCDGGVNRLKPRYLAMTFVTIIMPIAAIAAAVWWRL